MIFNPGESYYVLEAGELQDLIDLLADMELDYDLASDFTQADDGRYYAAVSGGGIDSEERGFMDDYGFLNILEYKKSTQSTVFVG